MTATMANQCLDLCLANVPLASRAEVTETVGLWLLKFEDIPDDLFYTAIMLCLETCKLFPTITEIRKSISDLRYNDKTKPKQQLPWSGSWEEPNAKKVFEMANGDHDTKAYLARVDVTELFKYAKDYFPDITEELVRQNYNELDEGMKYMKMCLYCNFNRNVCTTSGWIIKHHMENGYIVNKMARCQKNK